jgi:hypothetical protein
MSSFIRLTKALFPELTPDSVDEESARWWFSKMSTKKLTDKNVIRFILFQKQITGSFPSKKVIEDEICCVKCICELGYVESFIVDMKKYYLFNEGRLPTCRETENIMEYHTLNKKYPSYKELREYVENKIQFNSDPVEYFNNDKVDRPANIKNINIIIPKEDVKDNCAICFEDIQLNSYYKLTCGHCFHSNKENCLGEASIEEWFTKNNFCPNCKQKL